jgi:hypothetical protein
MSWNLDSSQSGSIGEDDDVVSFNGVLLVWRQANLLFAGAAETMALRMRPAIAGLSSFRP